MGHWQRDVVSIRNLALHLGREVARREALTAIGRTSGLAAFIADRLATPKNLAKYPRTALAHLGQAGLERRARWTRKVREIDRVGPGFERFMRWRHTLAFHWQGERRPAPDATLQTLAVLGPDRSVFWILADRAAWLAAPAQLIPGGLTDDQDRALRDLQRLHLQPQVAELRMPTCRS